MTMKACGLIVEYNPFHYGHYYHYEQAKKASDADCMIAVMSGNFLQRGEPAIMDKWHRANSALQSGIDIVLEIPYVFAVQHSDLFARGSVLTLDAVGVDTICFGSEQGEITPFIHAYHQFKEHQADFNECLREHLNEGYSFPEASRIAYEKIGLTEGDVDLSKPNNILGYSYTKTILEEGLSIEPLTIKRTKSEYHDETIEHKIASATSIRKEIFQHSNVTNEAKGALPEATFNELRQYKESVGLWHSWQAYFPFLQFKISTMSVEELRALHGVEEGLEYRMKQTIHSAVDFQSWMEKLKTKRYTWTRIQRALTHILTNTKKEEVLDLASTKKAPYVRLLGMNERGKQYINKIKKDIECPLISQLHKGTHPYLKIEERAVDSYLAVIPPQEKIKRRKREFMPPILP